MKINNNELIEYIIENIEDFKAAGEFFHGYALAIEDVTIFLERFKV